MWGDNDALDRYDDAARDEAAHDAHIDALLTEHDAARRALADIVPGMGPTRRWAILERFHAACVAVQDEQDRVHYGAINARVQAEIAQERRR